MAYTTLEQVQLRSRSNLDPDVDGLALEATIEEGIVWADSKIDSRLGQRYRVPFASPVPSLIAQISADLAAYYALVEIYSGGADNQPTLLAQELKARAFEALTELAEGTASLPDGESGSVSSASIPLRANTTGTAGALAAFDLVNRPCGASIPFASYKRWGG